MAFEKYLFENSNKPKILVHVTGLISFNNSAVKSYALTDYKFVALFFNKDKGLVGIKPAKNNSEDGITYLISRETSCLIYAKQFLDHFGIDYSETRSFPAVWDEEFKGFVINPSDEKNTFRCKSFDHLCIPLNML